MCNGAVLRDGLNKHTLQYCGKYDEQAVQHPTLRRHNRETTKARWCGDDVIIFSKVKCHLFSHPINDFSYRGCRHSMHGFAVSILSDDVLKINGACKEGPSTLDRLQGALSLGL